MPDNKAFDDARQGEHRAAHCSLDARSPSPLPSLAALLAVLAIGGCGPRDRTYDPSNFAIKGTIVPAGVVLPRGAKLRAGAFDGLYPEHANSLTCCWIAPRATLFVRKPKAAHWFVAGFYVPDIPLFARGQMLMLRFAAHGAAHAILVSNGQHIARVALPPDLRSVRAVIPVRIDARITYVPQREGDGTDDRRLGIVMLYAYFE